MADLPPEAIRAAVRAIQGNPWPDGEITEAQIATLVLEAAAPILAEAWNVTGREYGTKGSKAPREGPARKTGTREQESRPCRRCGAQPGRQCVTASGTGAPMPHAERRNDSRRAEGQTDGMEYEGMLLDRFPPRDIPSSGVTPAAEAREDEGP